MTSRVKPHILRREASIPDPSELSSGACDMVIIALVDAAMWFMEARNQDQTEGYYYNLLETLRNDWMDADHLRTDEHGAIVEGEPNG